MSDAVPPPPPPLPAVLRLVQTVMAGRWRATGEDLYREVARITEAAPGKEIVVLGCGEGVTADWLSARTGAAVTGIDPDRAAIRRAEQRRRAMPQPLALSFENSQLDDLPHETGVFDAAIAEPALSATADVERAISEALRVTKPMGTVIMLQLTWTSEIAAATRELVVERLGLRPWLVVEWKRMLREAGLVEIQVQDWSAGGPATRSSGAHPVASPELSWRLKAHIVGHAWWRWGWRTGGLRAGRRAVEREAQLLRELSRDRALGFQLIYGVKWPHERAS